MKRPIKVLGLCAVALPFSGCSTEGDADNLLVIIVDQMRYDALGASGAHAFIRTPNLDRLAGEGAYFTRAYTQCAVSGPGRACILTGLLVEHTGVLSNEDVMKDPRETGLTDAPTFDMLLHGRGYLSEFHGNWHSPIGWASCYEGFGWSPKSCETPFSFDLRENVEYRNLMREKYPKNRVPEGCLYENSNCVGPYLPDRIDRRALKPANLGEKAVTRADDHGMMLIGEDETLTAWQATKSIEAVCDAAKDGRPFNITMSLFNPHPPVLPLKRYRDLYDMDDIHAPESIADSMTDSPYRRSNGRLFYTEYADSTLVKEMARNYYASVSEDDYWIGRMLDVIDSLGLSEKTMVVFLADHGELLGAHGMRGKDVFYEEACRVPLIIRYPGKVAPGRIDAPVSTIDLFPTIMDYFGMPVSDRDGKSLRKYIEGLENGVPVVTEWLASGTKAPSHMIVSGHWKLMLNYSAESPACPALFDLETDPHEMCNLLGESCHKRAEYLAKANELRQQMAGWLTEHGSKYADAIESLSID